MTMPTSLTAFTDEATEAILAFFPDIPNIEHVAPVIAGQLAENLQEKGIVEFFAQDQPETDLITAVRDLDDQLEGAAGALARIGRSGSPTEAKRIGGKVEGVRLAREYLRDVLDLIPEKGSDT